VIQNQDQQNSPEVNKSEETTPSSKSENSSNISKPENKIPEVKPEKPKKPEEKPFKEFIKNHLLPELKKSLEDKGLTILKIESQEGKMPVIEIDSYMVFVEFVTGRRFWVIFTKEDITSKKLICLAEPGSKPSLIESFLIDEKKSTLVLLVSRILQRLNGQKWLGPN
tara:strand:+ start:99 stop:599 length:501 start_codon:yes stop_codon:yes gene_type:complete